MTGKLPTPNLHDAIRDAQEQNRALLLSQVKIKFAARHRGSGHTLQGFQATVRQDLNLSVYNRRPNASRVERGVWPYLGKRPKGSGRLPTSGGRLIFGKPTLSFFWEREGMPFVGRFVVHPGQKADPIMARTLEENRTIIQSNIMRHVQRELNRA